MAGGTGTEKASDGAARALAEEKTTAERHEDGRSGVCEEVRFFI